MPFVLLVIIASVVFLGDKVPTEYQSGLYALGLSVKSAIVFFLPFIVFGLLFKIAVHFSSKASKLILFLLVAICASNFFSTFLSYIVGSYVYSLDISIAFPSETEALLPLWDFALPKWIGNDKAMFGGLLSGILFGYLAPLSAKKFADGCDRVVAVLLKGILVVIPVLVAGSIVKMNYDGIMGDIFRNYGFIFLIIATSVFSYVVFIYALLARFKFSPFIEYLKNMIPAAVAGFGTMSSVAAMPLTILGVEKNAKNADVAGSVVPATVNIHLVGDCFAIPIFAFAVLRGFGIEAPGFGDYLIFASFFVLAKFSVASVPGGGILVMIPILESYLGFDAQMISFITGLYILFDPVITCANILGNGAFALTIDRLASNFSKNGSQTPVGCES